MAKQGPRQERLAEQIRRETADLLRLELQKPKLGLITLTDIELTRDYGHAKLFYTVLGSQLEPAEVQAVLDEFALPLRAMLGRKIRMYSIPQIHFVYDASVEHGRALSSLIEKASADIKDRDA